MADEASEDKKPSKDENSLNIRIRDQTGEETCVPGAPGRPSGPFPRSSRTSAPPPRRFFKVKKTTKLDKVFNARATGARSEARGRRARAHPARTYRYSQRKGVNSNSLRFLFDGQRVRGDQTPADIDMDDGDQLDCMLEQQGGARC